MSDIKKTPYIYFSIVAVVLILTALFYIGSRIISENRKEASKLSDPFFINETLFVNKNELTPEKYERARTALDDLKLKLAGDKSGDANAWFDFGYWKNYLGDKDGAIIAWEKSYSLNPLRFATSNNLGDLYYYHKNDFGKAEFYYLEALGNTPDDYGTYIKLADLYKNELNKKDAIEPLLIRGAASNASNKLDFWKYLWQFFQEENNQEKADYYLGQIRQTEPNFEK